MKGDKQLKSDVEQESSSSPAFVPSSQASRLRAVSWNSAVIITKLGGQHAAMRIFNVRGPERDQN